ncbi:hypothetical protein M0811_01263 [Anaeramoeba ignava]|uniref:Uncharacterized protein n=1 Tax=Anaeramoeba ignava TaxID=1746090 RepID=A0A9Q0R9N6_ANAIG|nr:hypothetical protein M0811_01263 [Anaeramoeba ignava]
MCNIGMYLTQPQKPVTSTLNSFGPVSNFDCSNFIIVVMEQHGMQLLKFQSSFGNTEDPTNVYVAVRPMKSTSMFNQLETDFI